MFFSILFFNLTVGNFVIWWHIKLLCCCDGEFANERSNKKIQLFIEKIIFCKQKLLIGIIHLVRFQNTKFSQKLTFLTNVCVSGSRKC